MKISNPKYHKSTLKSSNNVHNQKFSRISKIRNLSKIYPNVSNNTNKTIQKYINQKLNNVTNEKKSFEKNSHSFINKNKNFKHIKSKSINRTHIKSLSNTSVNCIINKSVNLSKNKPKISRNDNLNKIINQKRVIKGRNRNFFQLNDYNKPFNPNYFFNNNINIFSSHIDTYQLSSLTNNNTKYSTNNRLIKSPTISNNKTISIYKKSNDNSSSFSTIFSTNGEKNKKTCEFNETEILPHFNQDNSPLNTNNTADQNKNSGTNNYESDSIDFGNKVYLKVNENCSLTFGNSFSYSNSKMSSSTKKIRDENENLKKELEESNAQILFLKNEIEELMKKNTITNSKINSGYMSNNNAKKKKKIIFGNYSKRKEKAKKIRVKK